MGLKVPYTPTSIENSITLRLLVICSSHTNTIGYKRKNTPSMWENNLAVASIKPPFMSQTQIISSIWEYQIMRLVQLTLPRTPIENSTETWLRIVYSNNAKTTSHKGKKSSMWKNSIRQNVIKSISEEWFSNLSLFIFSSWLLPPPTYE